MTSPLKLTLFLAAATLLPPTAGLAQVQGQAAQAAQSSTTCLPEHAAMGHCTPASAERSTPAEPPATPPAQPSTQAQSRCLPEHAAMGHCTPGQTQQSTPPQQQPAPRAQPTPQGQSTCLPEHAAMGHCTPAPAQQSAAAAQQAAPQSQPATQPPSTCLPEHAAMGHCTPAPTAGAVGTDLPAGNAPPPPVPIPNAADAFYNPNAMAMGRHHLQDFHGNQKLFQVLNNIAEYRAGSGADGYGWESEGWYGGDINRFWFKTEGEGTFGEGVESAEVQALYSQAIDPYWNVQGGIRYDFKPNPSRVYATVQLEGLAPSFFDIEGALFLSHKGELMARIGGWYDQRITQRLILQPRVEFDLAAQNSRDIGVGAGLSEAEIGVRLRYDIRREFAPYIGIQYQRAFGRTAKYLRDEGEDVGGFQFLVGVRTWF